MPSHKASAQRVIFSCAGITDEELLANLGLLDEGKLSTLVKVYPDRIHIFNSGGLPADWTTDTLSKTHRSIQRNPNIAMTIFRTSMIEAWSSGIEQVVAGCRHIDAPDPAFDSLGDTTSIMPMAPMMRYTGQRITRWR
jgi:predicted HTH transcriptional regulator